MTGLCKVATLEGEDGIKDQDYSLNPGRYVGVVIEEEDIDFPSVMTELHAELLELQKRSAELMDTISKNLKEMGL